MESFLTSLIAEYGTSAVVAATAAIATATTLGTSAVLSKGRENAFVNGKCKRSSLDISEEPSSDDPAEDIDEEVSYSQGPSKHRRTETGVEKPLKKKSVSFGATAYRSDLPNYHEAVEAILAREDSELLLSEMDKGTITAVDVVQWRAKRHPHTALYTFLDDFGAETRTITLGELDCRARAVAAMLQTCSTVDKSTGKSRSFQPGDRVVLCFPPGLDFAVAFWGCLYAGAIAVPVYPPYPGTLQTDLPKFTRLVDDCGATIALTDRTYNLASRMGTLKNSFINLKKRPTSGKAAEASWPKQLTWYTVDNISETFAERYVLPVNLSDFSAAALEGSLTTSKSPIAFFQYSSGSTSAPKAVMISHKNLFSQLQIWNSIVPTDIMVSWLPSYHDMGLVGFIVVPAVMGSRCVSMSPISFIKDPSLWLRTVDKYRGTHICGPNFAFSLVARKVSQRDADKLNLRCLKQAIVAAEPIRAEAIADFTQKFKKAGFRPETYNCGYGLAECTLVCTGQDPEKLPLEEPAVVTIDKLRLERDRVAEDVASSEEQDNKDGAAVFVGCGAQAKGFVVKVVDPDHRRVLKDNFVGEIWVAGESVAEGYYSREEQSRDTFHATLASNDEQKYMRTGDLGFLRDGKLFVTGRVKDLIIVRGRNVAPQDVELSAELAHPQVRPGCVAAFSVDHEGEEKLVVVAELRSKETQQNLEEIVRSVQRQILSDHQLSCYGIVLLFPRTIPKTTSGKIQRHASKAGFLAGSLSAQKFAVFGSSSSRKGHAVSSKADKTQADEENDKTAESKQNDISRFADEDETSTGSTKTPEEALQWLLERLSAPQEGEAEQESGEIDPHAAWASFGMDSIGIVNLSSDFGEFLGCVVPTAAFFEYDTPHKLAYAPGLLDGSLAVSGTSAGASAGGASGDREALLERDENGELKDVPDSFYQMEAFEEVVGINHTVNELAKAGLEVPYLQRIDRSNTRLLNYNTYNYLGIAGIPEVCEASKKAIDEWGSTMSSSPIVGQNDLNLALEESLRDFFGTEAAVCFIGGWQANVSTISTLMTSRDDVIVCDSLNHNSCVTGQRLSGATVMPFPHNDWKACDRILTSIRHLHRRAMILIEGIYSMDGDIPDIHKFIELKHKHKAILFVDEAHSVGTLGATGRGVCEYFDVDRSEIDVTMGTMSKAIGSQGGFIVGKKVLCDLLKFSAGGFVFSVGSSPANAASAVKGLEIMQREPERIATLKDRSELFFDLAQKYGLNIGRAVRGAAVVPVVIGKSVRCVKVSSELGRVGVNVKPIFYPAVEEGQARLRFFISSVRSRKDIERTVKAIVAAIKRVEAEEKKVQEEEEARQAEESAKGNEEEIVQMDTADE